MSTKHESKINQLLQGLPKGTVVLASWLLRQGYSYDLQQRYIRSNWLEPIGKGAYKRKGEEIDLFGALYALQSQTNKKIHIGGRSSMALLGFAHYIEMRQNAISLFVPHGFKLPVWFSTCVRDITFQLTRTNMLPPDFSLTNYNTGNFSVNISNPARAMLECLEAAPDRFDLEEAWLIMEALNALQPEMVQNLLEKCRSVKAKRLFLFFSEKAGHTWFKYLSTENIDLGKGKRSIVKQGKWVPKYQITLPKILV